MSTHLTCAESVKVAALQCGGDTYEKADISYIKGAKTAKIIHNGGISNIPVSKLPLDIREQLGVDFDAIKKGELQAKEQQREVVERKNEYRKKVMEYAFTQPPIQILAGEIAVSDKRMPKDDSDYVFITATSHQDIIIAHRSWISTQDDPSFRYVFSRNDFILMMKKVADGAKNIDKIISNRIPFSKNLGQFPIKNGQKDGQKIPVKINIDLINNPSKTQLDLKLYPKEFPNSSVTLILRNKEIPKFLDLLIKALDAADKAYAAVEKQHRIDKQ